MADRYIRRVDGFICALPGCGKPFSSRGTPALPVCPECQAIAERHAEAEKSARKRARQRAARASQAACAPA